MHMGWFWYGSEIKEETDEVEVVEAEDEE